MSSEPIERRVSYLGDRLKASRCQCCGKEYFEIRDYCSNCGRRSYGKMETSISSTIKALLNSPHTSMNPQTSLQARQLRHGIVSFTAEKYGYPQE